MINHISLVWQLGKYYLMIKIMNLKIFNYLIINILLIIDLSFRYYDTNTKQFEKYLLACKEVDNSKAPTTKKEFYNVSNEYKLLKLIDSVTTDSCNAMKCAFRDIYKNHNYLELIYEDEEQSTEQQIDPEETNQTEINYNNEYLFDSDSEPEIEDSDNETETLNDYKILWNGCKHITLAPLLRIPLQMHIKMKILVII